MVLKLELRLDGAVATVPEQTFQARLCAFLKVNEEAVRKLQLSAGGDFTTTRSVAAEAGEAEVITQNYKATTVVNAVITMPNEEALLLVGYQLLIPAGDYETDLKTLSKKLNQQANTPSPLPRLAPPRPALARPGLNSHRCQPGHRLSVTLPPRLPAGLR